MRKELKHYISKTDKFSRKMHDLYEKEEEKQKTVQQREQLNKQHFKSQATQITNNYFDIQEEQKTDLIQKEQNSVDDPNQFLFVN